MRSHTLDYRWLVTAVELPLLRRQGYVDGNWVDADSGATFAVTNPATGEDVAWVPRMGAEETRRALAAAERALPQWKQRPARERAQVLRRLSDLMLEHEDDLARLMVTEQGKPLAEARVEVAYAASFYEWFGEEAKRVYGDTVPSPWLDKRILVTKEAVGVTVGITPWNFPAAMPARKSAPALAAGCTMVLKPAEQTPLSALAIAALAEEAGVPPGVFSIVTGAAEDAPAIGEEMTSSALVRKLGFTGSTEVGKLLMAQCASGLKRVSLELGGNAPFIVFDDADLDEAVAGALLCKFRNSGQTCISANRMLVQDGIYDAFLERFTDAVRGLKVAHGFAPEVNVGPLIDEPALEKVERHVANALDGGAELLVGGARIEGQFFQPSVLVDVTASMAMSSEETFGPVAGMARFSTEEEAIRIANDTPYGLAAYFYSQGLARVTRVAEALEYGILGINTGLISTEVAPFGGMKESGIGREGSSYGIDEWLELKYWAVGGMKP
ncbi:MAG: NAD-dependent succinate-semialdehyde dehydrogenase [Actinobacteria bacterium]|nr:NAD-dependent succinate-semialdehyde dehydrogenase [Actinomycetota bacterium]